jgi:hypothetical protein
MNPKMQPHEREIRILDKALTALTRPTGFNAAIITHKPTRAAGRRPGAEIQIEANGAGGGRR